VSDFDNRRHDRQTQEIEKLLTAKLVINAKTMSLMNPMKMFKPTYNKPYNRVVLKDGELYFLAETKTTK